jgi:uncharacterized protein (DUF39 family)
MVDPFAEINEKLSAGKAKILTVQEVRESLVRGICPLCAIYGC